MTKAAPTPRSNVLFASIVATVAATTDRRMTVREIALAVDADVEVTAQCIALHRYFRAHEFDSSAGTIASPMPVDFVAPSIEDLIDETALGLNYEPPVAA